MTNSRLAPFLLFLLLSISACSDGGSSNPGSDMTDTDGDGVSDSSDQCSNTTAGVSVDNNGCQVIQVSDQDVDGADDDVDQCQDTASGATVGSNGCDVGVAKLNATVAASSALQSAAFAIDGDVGTRWESQHGIDPSTLTLDLDGTYALSEVVVHWEAANARSYTVQGSNDNSHWTTLASVSEGAFGDRTDRHVVSGVYRYLRMEGTSRSVGNNWGYSIFEMEAYGSPGEPIPDSDNDGFNDGVDQCANTPVGSSVDDEGCAVVVVTIEDEDKDGIVDVSDICLNTPLGINVDSQGCPIEADTGDIVSLYNESTALESETQFDRGDALVTRWSDRPRTRHAREDQFQAYDHYIAFYFENRSSNIEIVDYVAKGGSTIEMNVRTLFPLSPVEAENRWWYQGFTTVAQYASNGIMNYLGFDGAYYNYQKVGSSNTRLGREIRVGDKLEFEISQFSDAGIPRGQANYYGTTFLYIVGEGVVPWYASAPGDRHPEDSNKIPEEYWLGGKTSIHYQYTDEPNDNFMQMATNLGYDNGQTFLLGRRVLHSSTISGQHDESPENGVFNKQIGLTGTKFINDRCTACHDRNGGAPVANNGESLDKWVFQVGDVAGNPDPNIGRVLQPSGINGEGDVSIASWTESEGLRSPNYQFSNGAPAKFSARIAPRLVGLGLLEAIPEAVILAREDIGDANGDGISGRANRIPDPANPSITRLGRFGWKAGTSSVKHQAAAALNTDMGVRTSLLPNPDCGSNQSNCGTNSPLMEDKNLEDLTLYLSTLGVRPQRGWEKGSEDQVIVQGKVLFKSIGCTGCHTETLQTSAFHPLAEVRNQTIHPYSDMLLHDMGPGLADNLGEGDANGNEWRTTPLWGLGLSACVTGGVINPTGGEGDEVCDPHHAYLHDGRARSIEEAILWHGGEGDVSRQAYQSQSSANKEAILKFLKSLQIRSLMCWLYTTQQPAILMYRFMDSV